MYLLIVPIFVEVIVEEIHISHDGVEGLGKQN